MGAPLRRREATPGEQTTRPDRPEPARKAPLALLGDLHMRTDPPVASDSQHSSPSIVVHTGGDFSNALVVGSMIRPEDLDCGLTRLRAARVLSSA